MTGDALLGIDVGTTQCKAALVEPDGHVVRLARRPTPTRRLPDGGAEHPLPELLAAVDGAIRDALDGAPPGRRVAGIGIASMAEAGAPLDSAGRATTDVLAWFDPRPADAARRLAEEVGAAALFARTGLRPEAKTSLAKLRWLADVNPGAEPPVAWAGVAELVAHALTGRLATTPSLACRTMLYDLSAGRWDPDLIALAGLDPAMMPEVLPLGRAAGALGREAAFRLGLPSGMPVAVAGHDHLVGALGVGVVRPGQVLDSLGTAEAALVVTDGPILHDAVRRSGFSTGAYPVPGRSYLICGLPAAGALVEWFAETFLDRGAGRRSATFADLVATAPERPTGIVVDPAFRGRAAPRPDPLATGSIRGLRFEHRLPDLARATLEGIAYQVRSMLEALADLSGRPIDELVLIGGATADERVLRLRAAVMPWPVRAARHAEAVAIGAALVGGLAAGIFADVEAATAAAVPTDLVARDPALADAYDRVYREAFLPSVRG